MSPELQNRLFKNYPMLFTGGRPSPLSKYGIQCDSGWFSLIVEMSDELTKLAKENDIIIKYVQVKEKMSVLVTYLVCYKANGKNSLEDEDLWDKVFAITSKYRDKSGSVCEITGSGAGEMYIREGYFKTLCPQTAILLGFEPVKKKSARLNI